MHNTPHPALYVVTATQMPPPQTPPLHGLADLQKVLTLLIDGTSARLTHSVEVVLRAEEKLDEAQERLGRRWGSVVVGGR